MCSHGWSDVRREADERNPWKRDAPSDPPRQGRWSCDARCDWHRIESRITHRSILKGHQRKRNGSVGYTIRMGRNRKQSGISDANMKLYLQRRAEKAHKDASNNMARVTAYLDGLAERWKQIAVSQESLIRHRTQIREMSEIAQRASWLMNDAVASALRAAPVARRVPRSPDTRDPVPVKAGVLKAQGSTRKPGSRSEDRHT